MIHYNATGMKESGGFTPALPGEYTMRIVNTTEKTTKQGWDMVNCECEIADGEYAGKKVWHNVVFIPKGNKGEGMALHFLHAIGQPYEGEFDTEPLEWIEKTFKAKLIIEKDLQGVERNKVQFIIIPLGEDGVPF